MSSMQNSSSQQRSLWTFPWIVGVATIATVAVVLLRPKPKRAVKSRPPSNQRIVSHMTIRCRDLTASLEFYQTIGFLEVSRTISSILVSLPKGLKYAPYLLLEQIPEHEGAVATETANEDERHSAMAGYGRVALLVPSIIRASNHLNKTLGLEPIAKPVTDMTTDKQGRPMGRITIAAWKDPDGTVVELVEVHSVTARNMLELLHRLGAFHYPLWIHANVNATHFEASWKAYAALGFTIAADHGRVKNKLYQSLNIPDPGIAQQVAMIKTKDDTFQIALIEWEDPKTTIPTNGLPSTRGLTSVCLQAASTTENIDLVPIGWESPGDAVEIQYPAPLGRAKVKTLLDPDGTAFQIVQYL